MATEIRKASERDQAAIRTLVRSTGLNPAGLDWRNFVIADSDGAIVGVAQIRPYRDGTRELASLVVVPERRHTGVARDMIARLLGETAGPVYTIIDRAHAPHFSEYFGFLPLGDVPIPSALRRTFLIGRAITGLASLFTIRKIRLVVLRRD